MAIFAQCDASGDASGTVLESHTTPDLTPHATWVKSGAGSGSLAISNAARIRATTSSSGVYYASQAPADADYTVSGILRQFSTASNPVAFLLARCSLTPTATFYCAGYNTPAGVWMVGKFVNGTQTLTLGTAAATLVTGQDYALQFEVEGTALRLYVDGVLVCSGVDSSISAKGLAGVRALVGSDSTGHHIDNWQADDTVLSAGNVRAPSMLLLGVG